MKRTYPRSRNKQAKNFEYSTFYIIQERIEMSSRRILITASLVLCPLLLLADEWIAGGTKQDGYFQSFTNGAFMLRSSRGRLLKEQPTRINKLTFDKPIKVTYITSDKKEPQEGTLKGYEKSYFHFEKDGKPVQVAYMKVRSMDRIADPTVHDNSGGGVISGIDTDSLEKRYAGAGMTPAQSAALAAYKAARNQYDTFINQSSSLVSQMNSASGMQRENLMNQLRKRKFDEQPIKNAMLDAQADLLDAFPDAGQPAPAVTGGAVGTALKQLTNLSNKEEVKTAPAQAPVKTLPAAPAATNNTAPAATSGGTGTVQQGDRPPDIEW
jgi:hypothetical protein